MLVAAHVQVQIQMQDCQKAALMQFTRPAHIRQIVQHTLVRAYKGSNMGCIATGKPC